MTQEQTHDEVTEVSAPMKAAMTREAAQAKYDALHEELATLQAASEKDGTNAQRQRAIRSQMRTLVRTYGLTHVIARGNKPLKEKPVKEPKAPKAAKEGEPAGAGKKARGRKKVVVAELEPVVVTDAVRQQLIDALTAEGITVNDGYDPQEDNGAAFDMSLIPYENEGYAADLIATVTAGIKSAPQWFAITRSGEADVVVFGPVVPAEDDDDF